MRIDINSDVGESFGVYTIGHDAGLMTSITPEMVFENVAEFLS